MTLVEFKTDVASKNFQTILQRANEAMGQLWHTFNCIVKPRCMSCHKDIEKLLAVDFHIVFDKDFETTAANSQLMDLQAQFLEDNKHLLFFDNAKTFVINH